MPSDVHPKKAGLLVSYRKAMIQVFQIPSVAAQIPHRKQKPSNYKLKKASNKYISYILADSTPYLMYKKDPTLKHA